MTPGAPAVLLRKATTSDADLLWRWRCDYRVYQWARNPMPVEFAEHYAWLEAVLSNPARTLFIAETSGTPVGTIRADEVDGKKGWAEVSITVAPEHSGRGLGSAALLSLTNYWGDAGGKGLLATIRHDNAASQTAFTKAGFIPQSGSGVEWIDYAFTVDEADQ